MSSNGTTNGDSALTAPRVPARRRPLFWAVVVVVGLLGAGAGFVWASRQDAGWDATGTIFVAFTFPPSEADPFGGAQFVTQRIDTYAQLAQSPDVLQAVAGDMGARGPADVADKLKVDAVPGTVLLRVTAHDATRDASQRLATSVMKNLNTAATTVEAGNVRGASPISLTPVQPPLVVPSSLLMTALAASGGGFAAGALLGALLGLLLCRARPRRATVVEAPRHGRHRSGTPDHHRAAVPGSRNGSTPHAPDTDLSGARSG